MPPDEPARPAPVVLRIKLRYDDVEVMIQRFSPNVGKTGLFLPTKSMQPIGAEVKFELRLSTDQPVLVGLGRVKASREPDPDNPKAAFGIAIELMRVTRESRDLILKMLERRKQLGLAEAGIPMPSDVDAARRSDFVETGVKAGLESGPVSMPVPAPLPDSQPSELLTAPRRQTGPIAVARVSSHVEPLAAEPPRKKRVPVAELVASASGPVSASGPTAMIDFDLDGLENVVDIAAAIARARVLAGSDLDGELEALRDAGAAPIEIGIEAASAELARQLGGAAVNRSARWAPPPPVEDASARDAKIDAPAGDAKTDSAEIEAPPVPMSAPPPASRPAPAPAVEAMATHAAEPTPIEPAPTPIDPAPIDSVPEPIEREVVGPEVYEKSEPVRTPAPIEVTPIIDMPAPPIETSSPDDELFRQRALVDDAEHEVEPDQIHDEIHRLTEGDFEEVENTQVGAMIVEPDQPEQRDSPEQAAIADRLERQLVEAEAEADADDLGFSLPHHQPGGERRQDSLEFALVAAVEQEQQDEEIEEIEEFEILAEADEQDADLLTAAAEQELSQQHVMGVGQPAFRAFDEPASRPSFLSRLELDDDSGYHAPVSFDDPPPRNEFDELAREPEIDPRVMSAGHALRQFESYEHPAYTTPDPEDFSLPDPRSNAAAAEPTFLAGFPDEFDAPHGNYGEPPPQYVAPDAFDQSDVISIHPDRPQGSIKPRPSSPPRAADVDLETALEALDVDLDDLGAANAPHSKRGPVVRAGKNRKAPTASSLGEAPPAAATRTPLRRASTEDGIDIDFDDE